MPRFSLRLKPVLAAILASALAGPGLAHAAIDLKAPIPVGPQVKVGKLPNGLTYYIHKNGKPENRLELRLVVKAGAVLEDDDQQGLAHVAEHLAFNGSTHFKKDQLVSWLQSIGVKVGADLNAATSWDQTVYMLPVPTQDKKNVEQAFTILEDWAHGVSFEDEAIEKERNIVIEELRAHKGAGERVRKVLMPKLFAGSRYAQRDIIGTEEGLRSFKPEALRRFYRDWYRPDLMAVVAVGDLDPAEIERQIGAHFGKLRNPAGERPRTYDDIRAIQGTETLIVTDPEVPTNSVALHFPVQPTVEQGSYGAYRDKTMERMFGLLMTIRLSEIAQQPNPPFLQAGSGLSRLTPRHQAYVANAALGAGGSAPAIAALLQEHQRVREYGFSADELERVRKLFLKAIERGYKERNTTSSGVFVEEYLRNFLVGETIPGIEAETALVRELVPGIGLDEMNAYARKTVPPAGAGKLVIYLGGQQPGSTIPTSAQLLAEVSAAEHAKVAARDSHAVASKLMDRPARPGGIVAESADKALGTTRLTFSNGIKVVLKPTAFHQDQVLLKAERFGGLYLFDEKDQPNVRVASSLVGAMGLKDFSRIDLAKALAGRNAGAGLSLDAFTEDVGGASGSSLDDIEAMLQQVWLRFEGVRRDEEAYKSFMAKQQEALRNRDVMPEARFGDAIVDTLYAKHPYEPRPLVLADLAKVDFERSIALYRQRFASAKGFTFVLAGNFEVEKIKPLLAAYLGTLPVADLPLGYRDVGLRPASGVIKREVLAGSEQKSIVSLHFSGAATWSPDEQLRLDALTEVVNLRIRDVLREKLGLIYGGQVGGTLARVPYQHYLIGASLPTAPDKVDTMVTALFAEIERIKQEGPDRAELEKVKSHWRQSWPQALQSNGYWLGVLNSAELYGIEAPSLLLRQERADAVTVEDVRQAARRYFDTNNYVQVVLKPEAGKPAATTGR